MHRHRIGISLGDPAGIGPEVVVRALAVRPGLDVVIYGDASVLARAARQIGAIAQADEARILAAVRPITAFGAAEIAPGRPGAWSAQAQLAYLTAATDAALAREIAALVTAPISKEWIARAGFDHPGHTEYLAARAQVTEFAMMLAGPALRVVLATTHLALRDVAATLRVEEIAATIFLTGRALHRQFGIARPRVAVAGLNPHAGEAGRFGDEESRLVVPAVTAGSARLAAAGIPADVTGPCVPDAVFRQAALGGFDAVVALYHDQGLIPVKLLHFDEAVNITLGLPFIRTSPDHGTAYDIAGTGQARPDSFLAALDLADKLASSSS